MLMLNKLEAKEWLELNAKLQQKKNTLRTKLNDIGVLQKDKTNNFDKYSYFSEAGYKKLFTQLFSECGLELSFTELAYSPFETTSDKQPNGRNVTLQFTLTDTLTGFFEENTLTGEGMDKGDKAGYKALTGALKYYLANTFMVATGDDPETESPEGKPKGATSQQGQGTSSVPASPKQLSMICKLYSEEEIKTMLTRMKVDSLEKITMNQANTMIASRKGK